MTTLESIQAEYTRLYKQLAQVNYEEEQLKQKYIEEQFQAKAFDWSKETTNTLYNCSIDELEYLIYNFYGAGCAIGGKFSRSIFLRGRYYGETWEPYTDKQYHDFLSKYLIKRRTESRLVCLTCTSLSHLHHLCPYKPAAVPPKCFVCQRSNHTVDQCRDLNALRKFANKYHST